jgi:hypothetical protein
MAQRATESKKRADMRVTMKKHFAKAVLAQQRVDALEHVAGVTARANADALAPKQSSWLTGRC